MVDAARPVRQSHQGVADMVNIIIGYSLPAGVVSIQILQFYAQDCSLDIVKTRITALIVEDILRGRAIVGDTPDDLSQLIIVGSDCATIAQRAKVLSRIETMGGSVAKRACLD